MRTVKTFAILILLAIWVIPSAGQIVQSGNIIIDLSEGKGLNPPIVTVLTDIEMIQNGGFETGNFTPWYHDGAWTISYHNPHTGTYCAYDIGNHWLMQDIPPTPASQIVSATVWCRQPEDQISAIDFLYSNLPYSEDLIWPTPNWTQYNVTSFIEPTGIVIGIRVWGYSGGGPDPDETYFDDISIMTAGAPQVSIELTPSQPIIYLPPEGGTFEYSALISNTGTSITLGDVWTSAIFYGPPDTLYYGPFLLRSFSLNPGASILRQMMQNVPAGAPNGIYHFFGKVGTYPATVWDEDYFEVHKGIYQE